MVAKLSVAHFHGVRFHSCRGEIRKRTKIYKQAFETSLVSSDDVCRRRSVRLSSVAESRDSVRCMECSATIDSGKSSTKQGDLC